MLGRFAQLLIRWGLLCAISHLAQAQPVRLTPVPTIVDFPQSAVEGIGQDRLGFLWVLTLEGLVRFDGLTADPWPMEGEVEVSPVLPFPRLWVDRFDALWILGAQQSRRLGPDRERWEVVSGQVVPDSAGHPWLWYRGRWARWEPRERLWRQRVRLAEPERWLYFDGRYAVALRNGSVWLYRLDRPDSLRVPLREALAGRRTQSGWEILTQRTLWRLSPQGQMWEAVRVPAALGALRAFWVDPDGSWWIGGSAGLACWRQGRWTILGLEAPRPEPIRDLVRSIFRDRQGILWVGSNWGLYRHMPHDRPFWLESARGNLRFVSAFAQQADGALLVATMAGSLWRLREGSGGAQRISLRRDMGPIWALLPEPQGGAWVGAGAGLFRITPRGSLEHVRAISGVQALAADASGSLWVGAGASVWRFTPPARWDPLPLALRGAVRWLYPDGDSLLWIGTERELLSWSLPQRRPRLWALPSGYVPPVTHIGRDRRGRLWVSTARGLLRLQGDRLSPAFWDPEAPSRMIYGFLEDDQGALWLSSNRGLYRYEPDAGRFWFYRSGSGLGVVEFNRGALYRDSTGALWFGGDRGVVRIEPHRWRPDPYPPVPVLRRLRWQDGNRHGAVAVRDPTSPLELHLSWRASLLIELGAVGYLDPERFRFAYRLAGSRDAQWLELGAQRLLVLGALRPGSHELWVRAANADGVLSAPRILLRVRISPPWWETPVFYLLLVGLVVSAVVLVAWARIRRLKEREQLRAQLAADLHDELGSELGLLAMELALRAQRQSDPQERFFLDRASDRLRALAYSLADLVWSLDPRYDTLWDWVLRVRSLAAMVLGDELSWRVHVGLPEAEARALVLPSGVRFHLLRLLKEALYNVRRHAQAQQVEVALHRVGRELFLCVADDGLGFDPEALPRRGGLRHIELRVRILKGRWNLHTAPGSGTRIEVWVSLPRLRDAAWLRGLVSLYRWKSPP
ncbi:MAG: hypothetical protein N2561_05140 [Bacteroidetes bacterium]|nr:hypothetical protein [Bacteroidota bacterium]